MNRTAAIASSLLRRLAVASSRLLISTRSISTGPVGSRRSTLLLRIPQSLSPSLRSTARGFAGRRREAAPSDEEEDEEEFGEEEVDVDDLGSDGEEWSDDGEEVEEQDDKSD